MKDVPTTTVGVRHNDPITSVMAAQNAEQSALEQIVFDCLVRNWPNYLTTIEIANLLGIHPWSVSPRLRPLWRKGYIEDPIKKIGINSNGNPRLFQAWRIRNVTR